VLWALVAWAGGLATGQVLDLTENRQNLEEILEGNQDGGLVRCATLFGACYR